ncbi:MAG: hypothetical protein DMG24_11960 [Acidobacteria bacterium]|nr:MAG: hypothetical protein DMG24_11960 [Acidobacteriota bacterium]
MLLVIHSGSAATLAVAFGIYSSTFLPLTPLEQSLISSGVIAALTLVNIVGVRAGTAVQTVFTFAKLAGLAIIMGWALFARGVAPVVASRPLPMPHTTMVSFGVALIGVLWAYEGWHMLSFTAGEVKDPARVLPRSYLLGGLLVIGASARPAPGREARGGRNHPRAQHQAPAPGQAFRRNAGRENSHQGWRQHLDRPHHARRSEDPSLTLQHPRDLGIRVRLRRPRFRQASQERGRGVHRRRQQLRPGLEPRTRRAGGGRAAPPNAGPQASLPGVGLSHTAHRLHPRRARDRGQHPRQQTARVHHRPGPGARGHADFLRLEMDGRQDGVGGRRL